MIFKIYRLTAFLIAFIVLSTWSIHGVGALTNSIGNTYSDPKTGISFQYPSDWHVASKEYVDTTFGQASNDLAKSLNDKYNSSAENAQTGERIQESVKPIVMLLPESMSGSTFFILSEILPFEIPIDKYFELTKKNIILDPMTKVSEPVAISVGGWNGLKYNVTNNNNPSFVQTQMLFVKDSKGYVVVSQSGFTDKNKESQDLQFITNSLRFNNTK